MMLVEEEEYLREVRTPNSDFEGLLAALRSRHPNTTTLKLSNYVKVLAASTITVAFQRHMADHVAQYRENVDAGVIQGDEPANDEDIETIIQAFERGLGELHADLLWRTTSAQIAAFALRASCPVVN